MPRRDDTKGKIIDMMSHTKAKKHSRYGTAVVGRDGIITVGDYNTVTNIVTPQYTEKTTVVVKPGEGTITEAQAASLKAKVDEIIRLEKIAKRKSASYGKVWGSLNKKMGVASYRMISSDNYPKAIKYLSSWIGRLSSTKSAAKKDDNWKQRKYSYIHVNLKKMGCEDQFRSYLQQRFGVESLTVLTDDDLVKAYQTVAYWKRKENSKG